MSDLPTISPGRPMSPTLPRQNNFCVSVCFRLCQLVTFEMSESTSKAQQKSPPDERLDGPSLPKRAWWAHCLANRSVIVSLLLVGLTLVVYWPVAHFDFINFDDNDYVSDNFHVQAGLTWSGTVWAFTTSHSAYWHPLTWLSHMLDAELFGKGPAGPHVMNLLFHLANTVLLFLLLKQMTRALAERIRGGAFCVASVARGIGGLDFGAEGCFKHILRILEPLGLRQDTQIYGIRRQRPRDTNPRRPFFVVRRFITGSPCCASHWG